MPIGLRDISGIDHEYYMNIALSEAEIAGKRGDLPIGSVIIHNGKIVGKGSNRIYSTHTSINHAEITVIQLSANYLYEYGRESIIYTTLEPCIMCLSTIIQTNIRNIIFGMEDNYLNTGKAVSGVSWLTDRMFNYIGGIKRTESLKLLKQYCNERDYNIIVNGKEK